MRFLFLKNNNVNYASTQNNTIIISFEPRLVFGPTIKFNLYVALLQIFIVFAFFLILIIFIFDHTVEAG